MLPQHKTLHLVVCEGPEPRGRRVGLAGPEHRCHACDRRLILRVRGLALRSNAISPSCGCGQPFDGRLSVHPCGRPARHHRRAGPGCRWRRLGCPVGSVRTSLAQPGPVDRRFTFISTSPSAPAMVAARESSGRPARSHQKITSCCRPSCRMWSRNAGTLVYRAPGHMRMCRQLARWNPPSRLPSR